MAFWTKILLAALLIVLGLAMLIGKKDE